MENASRALILAGSILIAILIIALGVMIFNRAQNSVDTTALSTTEINMFNSKFERYSDNQLGSQVKSMLSFAISNASTNGEDPIRLPTIKFDDVKTAEGGAKATKNLNNYIDNLSTIRNNITSTHTYKVTCSYATTGLIYEITISYIESDT